jgi:putative addiction module component (TIGR02574 family)
MASPAIDIEKMTPEERLRLIEDLWESLRAHPADLPLPSSHRDELDKRLDEIDRGDNRTIPWEEVKRHLRDREK